MIGGMNRLDGAWVGALVFVIANNYVRDIPGLNQIGLGEARFNTIIGIIFLVIVLLSPDGLIGIGQRITRALTPARMRTSQDPGRDSASSSSEMRQGSQEHSVEREKL